MNKAQLMAFEIIQTLIERILEIQDEREEEMERVISEELLSLLNDYEEEPSTAKKVNEVKLPKNWGKVNGVKF